ncbi:unnamed protein product [Zymoseptoria tritici ST99CH_3D1]|nr:unnamed protein product [Zymoseptoria tritici ST99CH_3D1]
MDDERQGLANSFPAIPTHVQSCHRTAVTVHEAPLCNSADVDHQRLDIAAATRAAWALLTGLYVGSDGVTVAMGHMQERGTDDIQFDVRVVPCSLGGSASSRSLCRVFNDEDGAAISSGARECSSCPASVFFAGPGLTSDQKSSVDAALLLKWSRCALVLWATWNVDRIRIEASFDPEILPKYATDRLLRQLCHIAQCLGTTSDIAIESLDLVSDSDRQTLLTWNSGSSVDCETSLVHLIKWQATTRPNAQAVSAHDGRLLYAELYFHAERLAAQLMAVGVKPRDYVPILLEKTVWAPVAMLAVLVAGAAFVPLSPQYPTQRLELICNQVNATVAISSSNLKHALQTSVSQTVIYAPCHAPGVALRQESQPSLTSADDVAYVLFTSGSTGQPKGAMTDHRAIIATARGFIAKTKMGTYSRMLQFGNFIFGAAMIETWTTFVAGGCLCIPSEQTQLTHLDMFIAEHGVDTAFMTPSFARLQSPNSLPGLQTLTTGGEAVTPDLLERWAPYVKFYTVYGSAEQAHIIAMDGPMRGDHNGASIGRLFEGSSAWVVKPDNPDQLVPLGCLGELITEGPQTAQGYVKDTKRTEEAFRQQYAWRAKYPVQAHGASRFYRTGDFVRYTLNGCYEFVSRREGYVKLHGQRLELGEVEYLARQILPATCAMCVEVVTPKGETADQLVLMMFVGVGHAYMDGPEDSKSLPSENTLQRTAALFRDVRAHLTRTLPAYMVPEYYFPMYALPMTISGKTARKQLQELGGTLDRHQLQTLSMASTGKMPVQTSTERYLQQLWSRLLVLPEATIHADDTFFGLGGNSLKAVELLQALRHDGMGISMRDILVEPRLSYMAIKCETARR